MKKKIVKIQFSALILALVFSVALACTTNESETAAFVWSDAVPQTVTAEAYTDYTFPVPVVTLDGKNATVSVTVKKGEETVAHDGVKFYVDDIGTYTVTYTASVGGKSESASTKLISSDTVFPVAAAKFGDKLKYYTRLSLNDDILLFDGAGIKADSVEYEVFDVTGGEKVELTEGFDKSESELYVTDDAVKKIRISVTAADNNGNAGTTDLNIDMIPASLYGKFDFEHAETGATAIEGISYANTAPTMTIKEDGGFKYAEFVLTNEKANDYSHIIFDESLAGYFGSFDYVEIDMKNWTEDGNGGNLGLNGIYNYSEEGGNLFNKTEDAATWHTYRFSGKNSLDGLKKGTFDIQIQPFAAQTAHFCIKEIRGGFDTAWVSNTVPVDLTERLGLSSDEFIAKFDDEPVADVTAFTAPADGTLSFTVVKSGYVPAELEIAVRIDNDAPEITAKLGSVGHGVEKSVSDFVNVTDKAGLKAVEYKLFDITGDEPAELDFIGEKGDIIKITDTAVTKIRIAVTATDILEQTSSENIDVLVAEPEYGKMTFEGFVADDARIEIPEKSANREILTDSERGTYFKYSGTLEQATGTKYLTARFDKNLFVGFEKFDYVDVVLNFDISKNGDIYPGKEYTHFEGWGNIDYSYGNRAGWITARIKNPASIAAFGTADWRLVVCVWAGSTPVDVDYSISVAGFTGGFDEISVGGTKTFDLAEKLGLNADEFTASFEGEPVDDVTAFSAIEDGTLTVTVNKEGFKTGTLTVPVKVDNTAPEILPLLSVMGYNSEKAVTELVSVTDASGVDEVTYALYDVTSGEEVALDWFDPTNKTVLVSDGSIEKIRIKVTAVDNFGNSDTKNIDITLKRIEFNKFTFDGITANNNQVAGITKSDSITVMEILHDETEGDYLHYAATPKNGGAQITINLAPSLTGDLSHFDWFELRIKFNTTSGGWFSFGQAYLYPDGHNDGTLGTLSRNEWITLKFSNAKIPALLKNNAQFIICVYAKADVDMCLSGITCGYGFTAKSNVAVNLSERLGLNIGEFTASFDGEAVADVTAFTPTKSGVLELTVDKPGYVRSVISAQITIDDDAPVITQKVTSIKYNTDVNVTAVVQVTETVSSPVTTSYSVFDISSGSEAPLAGGGSYKQ